MTFRDIDIFPDETSRAILKELEKFTTTLMRPVGIELDDSLAPSDVFAIPSRLWDVFAAFRELDLHLADIPEDLGGIGRMDEVTAVMAAERMGYGDAGLAIGLLANSAPFRLAAGLKTPAMEEMVRQFSEDRQDGVIGCHAISRWRDQALDTVLTARPDGTDFLVSGEIVGVVNASIATHGAFNLKIVLPDQTETRGLAIILLDKSNISRETPLASSQRSMPRVNLRFVEARVPGERVITEKDAPIGDIIDSFTISLNQSLAGVYVGLASAALDEAVKYAKERVQGGVPIFHHRNIRLQLFNMFKMIEGARAGVLRAAAYHDQQGASGSWPHAVAARSRAVETACHVTSEAIQVFGGYGLAREFPLEKFFRDARMGQVENGVSEDLAIEAMLGV